ncbi:unnamed protein product [Brassicogethes aeneus]|uniref:V-type proton ATPase subunit E n=1 Tax=Brassicogethes aeneus TaxID=1431903 RepID=A0A9P0FF78_BRAAE|nr:unnamed protein product [Brassicogethes aeneus]
MDSPMDGTRIMESLILSDALEKEEEIQIMAEDEFQRKKREIVKVKVAEIDKIWAEKHKKLMTEHAMQVDKYQHDSKMKVQEARTKCVEMIEADVMQGLVEHIKNEKNYRVILKQLIVQALCMLLEREVSISVMKRDVDLVKKVLDEAAKEYRKLSGETVKITISNQILGNDCIGGVKAYAKDNKILLDNTLIVRIRQTIDSNLPLIRLIYT